MNKIISIGVLLCIAGISFAVYKIIMCKMSCPFCLKELYLGQGLDNYRSLYETL